MTFVILDEAELEFLEAVNYYEEAAGDFEPITSDEVGHANRIFVIFAAFCADCLSSFWCVEPLSPCARSDYEIYRSRGTANG